ncbi:uncharacterized protein LOC134696419 isoform X1 [Mytilus trossulus]|uniref:uncharacterized protein LOC134696419 isoform X1 n=1 Tax=Mytilus trossulus TaxID=6551 RepID=UPI003006348E
MEKRFPAIFGIITLVLLCAGAFSPWWFAFDNVQEGAKMSGERHYTSDSIEVYIGLFYYVAVGEDFRKVMGYEDFIGSTTIKIGLLEYQVEVILGIVLCLISVILTFTYKKEGTHGVLVAIFIMYIIAGISTFIAVGRWFTRMIHVSFNIYSIKPIGVPYSLILSGIGALFCGIIMIYVSFMYCQHTAARPALVYSGVAMTEYPQTQPYTEGPLPYGQGPVPYGQEPPPYEQLQGKHSIV